MTFSARFRPIWVRLLALLAVVGPGIITANVDNDAGGITTYSVAGAHYGYSLLWMMLLVAVALIVVQEMSARLGVVTGKGLSDLIRETHGRAGHRRHPRASLVLANLANTVSEFAGVAASMEIFGVSKYISVPIVAVGVWLLIVKGNYKVGGARLPGGQRHLPGLRRLRLPGQAALAGRGAQATVTPTFQFDAGLHHHCRHHHRHDHRPLDAVLPAVGHRRQGDQADRLSPTSGSTSSWAASLPSSWPSLSSSPAPPRSIAHGLRIETAEDAAVALRPLAGTYASTLFALGLLNASVFCRGHPAALHGLRRSARPLAGNRRSAATSARRRPSSASTPR